MIPKDVSPWALRGLYLLALIITVSPLLDLAAVVWPLRPGELLWRYGALGLAAGHLLNLALGLALVMAVAYGQEHRRLLWLAGLASVVLSALILSAMAIFALDLVAVRALRAEELRGATLIAGLTQQFKFLISGMALASLGLGGLRMGAFRSVGAEAEVSPGVLRPGNK